MTGALSAHDFVSKLDLLVHIHAIADDLQQDSCRFFAAFFINSVQLLILDEPVADPCVTHTYDLNLVRHLDSRLM